MSTPENLLLHRLDESHRTALSGHFQRVWLDQRQTLYEPYEPIRRVYFPVTAVCSMVSVMAEGQTLQVATIGCEGLTGATLALAGDSMPFRTLAHVEGECYAMDGDHLLGLLAEDGYFRSFVQRYVLAFMVELGQTVGCSSLHQVEGRLARWLLLSHDRAQRDDFEMTHDLISEMLGVRRASVTEAAGRLQARGAIAYSRGHIRVSDRRLLESAACECYAIIREAYDRLLEKPAAA